MTSQPTSGAPTPIHDKLTDWWVVARLPPEAQRLLVEASRVRVWTRGDMSVRQGDPLPGLGWLARGLLWFWLLDADGRENGIDTAWSDSISMASLAGPKQDIPWNVTALAPSAAFVIPWDALAAVRRRHPLDELIVQCAAAEYRRRVTWESWLCSVRLRPRLLLILRRMADEFGGHTKQGVLLDFPVTQGDLARLARVTRDEVGRVMRELRADGLVSPIGRRGLLIPHPDRLGRRVELP